VDRLPLASVGQRDLGKGKESRKRPGVNQRVPGGLGSHISWHSAREGCEVSPMHRPPLPTGNVPGTHFHLGRKRLQGRGTVGRKYVTEKSSDTTGNGSRDCPTIAQRLNHYATPDPRDLGRLPKRRTWTLSRFKGLSPGKKGKNGWKSC
jgi:hypothetical protein